MSGNAHEKETKSVLGYRLGSYVFTLQTNELKDSDGDVVHVRSQSTDVLRHLAERHGELVSKTELIEKVWPDTFVTDDSLVQCIADIRRALNDHDHRIIQTSPKRGYRLQAVPIVRHEEPVDSSRAQRLGSAWPLVLISIAIVIGVALLARTGAPEFEPVDPGTLSLPLPEKPSIAVLAFTDQSQGADQGYLSDAISEELITRLSRFPDFFVIARNSSFHYREKPADLRLVARELGVRYVLDGTQQKAGERLRINARLIDATAGNTIWVGTYERDLSDIFALQNEITRAIAASLEENINQAEFSRLSRQPTESLAAYDLVTKSRAERLKFTADGHEAARRLSEQALELDPGYSEAYFSLAWVHINCFRWGWCAGRAQDQALDLAFQAARKAIELDPDSSLAHWALANATMQGGDLEQARIAYDRAISLNPNSAGVLADSAETLVYLGHVDEAVARIRAAIRLNPHHPDWYLWTLAWAQYFAGAYEDGLGTLAAMKNMPNLARRTKAALLVRLNRTEEARAAIAELLEHQPDYRLSMQRHSLAGKFRDPRRAEQFFADLRSAGLPD